MRDLPDQQERDRFVGERERHLSLIAPAGVGKTHTIVQRLIQIAGEPRAEEILPRLVVVTFSVKAAQEMQARARMALAEATVTSTVRRAFQQIYFGTIHSYCVRLLERFGSHLGLTAPLTLVEDEQECWEQFLRRGFPSLTAEDEQATEILFALYPVRLLFDLGLKIPPGEEIPYPPEPEIDFQPLLDYQTSTKGSTKASVLDNQEKAREWWEAWQKKNWRALPERTKPKDTAFLALWDETFSPVRVWLQTTALAFGQRLARRYETFRLTEGMMTYDDQLRLALRLLKTPLVEEQIHAEKISVILDEAQDTSPLQFEILRRLVGLTAPTPSAGTLSIVGDFQQLIYDAVDKPGAEAGVYQRVHEELSRGPRGATSTLAVTFRCDQAIVDFVNHTFPRLLSGADEQVSFVPLVARENAGNGQVVRWTCSLPNTESAKKTEKVETEARFIAQHLQKLGPAGLGVASWQEVALLCPRNEWLAELARELHAAGLPVQLHTTQHRPGAQVGTRWITALIWVAAHPEDSFEVAGILRDLYGISDHDLAVFTARDGDKLRLDKIATVGTLPIEQALHELSEAVKEAARLPLYRAIRFLAEKTKLLSRVVSCPEEDEGDIRAELEEVFLFTAQRAAQGATLVTLAEELRHRLGQRLSQESEVRDALQLVSSFKAKGLEWSVVILPFLFRPIGHKTSRYPRCLWREETEKILLTAADQAEEEKIWAEKKRQQSLTRLLYVMATRARKTLILLDDESVWKEKETKRRAPSAADLWRLKGDNEPIWQALPETLAKSGEKVVSPQKIVLPSLVDLSKKETASAIAQAGKITRRVTPYALARHESPDPSPQAEDRPESVPDNPGTLYGTWWHETVQELDWSQPREHWLEIFARAVVTSPQPERSCREWELFLCSEFAAWLSVPNRLIHQEWPFLWPESAAQCVEGVMDLVALDEEKNIWHVVDWKTNRIAEGGAPAIVEIYRGQIEAYVRALREMLNAPVQGSLYLTSTGELVKVL